MHNKELKTIDTGHVLAEVNELAAKIAEASAAGESVAATSDSPYADM